VLVGAKEEGEVKKDGEKDEEGNPTTTTTTDGVISVVFAAGASALRREGLALDLSESSSSSSSLRWADECSALPRGPGAADGNRSGSRSRRRKGRNGKKQPPPLCRPLLPFALRLEARHGGVQASGWWSTTGFVLREPARAAFDLTPALVTGVLSKINPLLAGAVRLREDDAVRVTLWPMSSSGFLGGGHLPASSVKIGMRSLRLQMEPNAMVAGSLRLVSAYQRAASFGLLKGGGKKSKENSSVSSSSSSSAFASFFSKLTGNNKSSSSSSSSSFKNKNNSPKKPKLHQKKRSEATLEAWTSSLSATLRGGNRSSKGFWVDSGRLDMLISRSGFAASGAKVRRKEDEFFFGFFFHSSNLKNSLSLSLSFFKTLSFSLSPSPSSGPRNSPRRRLGHRLSASRDQRRRQGSSQGEARARKSEAEGEKEGGAESSEGKGEQEEQRRQRRSFFFFLRGRRSRDRFNRRRK